MRGGNPVILLQAERRADAGGLLADAGVEISFVFALAEENARLFVAHPALHEHFVEIQVKFIRRGAIFLNLGLHHRPIGFRRHADSYELVLFGFSQKL